MDFEYNSDQAGAYSSQARYWAFRLSPSEAAHDTILHGGPIELFLVPASAPRLV